MSLHYLVRHLREYYGCFQVLACNIGRTIVVTLVSLSVSASM